MINCPKWSSTYLNKLYDNNMDFKEYVDKYCENRHKTVKEALTHKIVQERAKYGAKVD